MATTVTVSDGNGKIGTVTDWSIQDDATPTILGEFGDASMGSIDNLTAGTVPDSVYLNGNTVTIDSPLGIATGVIDRPTIRKSTTTLTAARLLAQTNIEVVAPPIYGGTTLSGAYAIYLGLCYDVPPLIDYQASSDPVVNYEGWRGVASDYLRNLGAATKTEMAEIDGAIVIRDVGTVEQSLENVMDDGVALTISTQNLAQKVSVIARNTASVNSIGTSQYNYSTNPSLESNATDWSNMAAFGNSWSTTPVRSTAAGAYSGSYSYTGVLDVGMAGAYRSGQGDLYHTFPVSSITNGTILYCSLSAYASSAQAVSTGSRLFGLEWLDSGGATISSSYATPLQVVGTLGTWVRVSISAPKPSGAVNARLILIHSIRFVSTAPASVRLGADAALVAFTPQAYFDGNSPGGAWTGATNNSTSILSTSTNVSFYDAYLDNNNVISVSPGETVEVVLNATGSPAQLGALDHVASFPVLPGQYYISASDGLPVTATQWSDHGGGAPQIEVGTDPNTILLTWVGPSSEIPSAPPPYSLAASSGGTQYATLNIAAAGVSIDPQEVTFVTGAPVGSQVQGPVVDIPFIENYEQARDRGGELSGYYGGPRVVASASIPSTSANGIGLTQGATVEYGDNKFRILTSRIDAGVVQIDALNRVTGNDFDAVWSGKTGNDFDAVWTGHDGSDFSVKTLRGA